MFESWLWKSIPVTLNYLAFVVVLSSLVALVISLLSYWFYFNKLNDTGTTEPTSHIAWWHLFLPSLVLALIGGMSGQLGGASREGVVGNVIPALFTLLGAYGAYLLGEKRIQRPLLLPNGLSFVFAFFLLYNVAAVWRQETELVQFCRNLFADSGFHDTYLVEYRNRMFSEYCKLLF